MHEVMIDEAMLLSVRPRYASKILAGEKTVELRRTRPRVGPGDWVLVYASSPCKALVGAFEVANVVSASPAELWGLVGWGAAVPKEDFDSYYFGADIAHAIVVKSVTSFIPEIPLDDLRRKLPEFTPPRAYRYLDAEEIRRVCPPGSFAAG